jgi:N-glycosylase/DNA lyase
VTAHALQPARLHETVGVVCDLLRGQVACRNVVQVEEELRYELVACLLGSQVRAESADAAQYRLSCAGLLSDERWRSRDNAFENEVADHLANRFPTSASKSSYRFPSLRARQLAQLRTVLQAEPLSSRLAPSCDARRVRAKLVQDLPGIGPKQASMFMRNVGASYDVAILDVHVLSFFQRIGLLTVSGSAVSTLKTYEKTETVANAYAVRCGHPVGYLDWAIWITMRAAKELEA